MGGNTALCGNFARSRWILCCRRFHPLSPVTVQIRQEMTRGPLHVDKVLPAMAAFGDKAMPPSSSRVDWRVPEALSTSQQRSLAVEAPGWFRFRLYSGRRAPTVVHCASHRVVRRAANSA